MNISPTPRRYASRSTNGNGMNYNNLNANNADPAYIYADAAGGGYNAERIIPEEYKLNSQMINRLIKQNKDLVSKLDSKQEEIDRLNILVGSLRGKLIKYTEMNKKLQENMGLPVSSRTSSESISENEKDYIQVPKRRTNFDSNNQEAPHTTNDDRITALGSKLDKLTNLVLESGILPSSQQDRPITASINSNQNSKPYTPFENPMRKDFTSSTPSEEDIMCRESLELKQMEDQIESLKRKLLIKRENELRKISLNQELFELMDKLNIQTSPIDSAAKPSLTTQAQSKHARDTDSEYCSECHHNPSNSHTKSHNTGIKPDINLDNPLETPTPAHNTSSRLQPESLNRIW